MSKRELEEKKKYLNEYSFTLAAVERLTEQIRELEKSEQFAKTDNMDIRVADTSKREIADYLIKKEELICDLYKVRYKQMENYQRLYRAIEALPTERERQVMTYRYIQRLTWEKTAVKMHMEWAQVHRIHAKALNNFIIPE